MCDRFGPLCDTAVTVDGCQLLSIARWSFASVPGVMHMSPMAQDFHAAFGLGDDATRLAPMDVQGVALAAIQGLNAKLEAKVAEQARELAALRAQSATEIAELRLAVEVLMARSAPEARTAQAR